MEKATFGGGCFWGIEHAFRKIKGVKDAPVGYSGGASVNPTYEEVCTGQTGHAEVVHIDFDPNEISYKELLNVFWTIHDPTTLNRQGPDVGTQYRSVIFFHSEEQEKIARTAIDEIQKEGKFRDPIVTEVSPIDNFYKGEEYHQRYFEKQGRY